MFYSVVFCLNLNNSTRKQYPVNTHFLSVGKSGISFSFLYYMFVLRLIKALMTDV